MGELTKLLAQLEGREFECFIRDLWAARGWDTQLTPKSGDDGTDIILERNEFYYQRKLVQTKCIQPDDKLSRQTVQQYSYLLHQNNVDEAILVTTGEFTNGGRQSADIANLKLIDGEVLESLVFDTIGMNPSEFDPEKYVPTYNFDTTTEKADTEDGVIPNSDSIDLSDIPAELRSTVDELSNQSKIYNRLLATLRNEHLSWNIRLSILFQLFRGNDSFHVLLCIDAQTDYRSLLDRVIELQQPTPAKQINCRRADVETVVGTGPKSTLGQPGLISELDRGLLALSEFNANQKLREHLVEPLEGGKVRYTKLGSHETVDLSFSSLAVGTPKYGSWDVYEPIGEQIPFGPSIITAFDVFICGGGMELNPPESIDIDRNQNAEPLDDRVFKVYRQIAGNIEPVFTDDAKDLLGVIERKIKAAIESEPDVSELTQSHIINGFKQAAKMSARIQLRESVLVGDVRRASAVLPYHQSGIDFWEIVETASLLPEGTDKTEKMEDIIKSLETDIDEGYQGVPIDEVVQQANKIGMSRSEVMNEIENLKSKAVVYEPLVNHLRTI